MISLLLLSGWSLAFPLLHTWRLRPSPSTPASPLSAAAGSAISAATEEPTGITDRSRGQSRCDMHKDRHGFMLVMRGASFILSSGDLYIVV